MAQPIPVVAASAGDAQDAPAGAIPFAAYGFGGSGSGAVESVNGQTGEVTLDSLNIPVMTSEPEMGSIQDLIFSRTGTNIPVGGGDERTIAQALAQQLSPSTLNAPSGENWTGMNSLQEALDYLFSRLPDEETP